MSEANSDADGVAVEAALGAAIEHVLREHGSEFTLKWVALVETSNADGERGMWTFAGDDVKAWDTLGLLDYGRQLQIAQIIHDKARD